MPIANCWSGDSWSYSGDTLPCATNSWGLAKNSMWSLRVGYASTNLQYYYDTDAIGARAGCLLEVIDSAGVPHAWDRRGKSAIWLKITNLTYYTVTRYIC
ncbi:hypothetical protein ACTMTI_35830 [Nonomuraea sp. H19]|uniref:hypothetical protein n=1 Tax=Nonomuraea sp. H19 TaxID=3452206 RepID=UPI003F89FE6F